MIYCRCGQYLLWERDHWACQGCGASPWRCECRRPEEADKELKRIDYGSGGTDPESRDEKSLVEKIFG